MPTIEEEPFEDFSSSQNAPIPVSTSSEFPGPDLDSEHAEVIEQQKDQPPDSPITASTTSTPSSPSSSSSDREMSFLEPHSEEDENELIELSFPPEVASRIHESNTVTFEVEFPANEPIILPVPRPLNTFEMLCAPNPFRPLTFVNREGPVMASDGSFTGVIYSSDPAVEVPPHVRRYTPAEILSDMVKDGDLNANGFQLNEDGAKTPTSLHPFMPELQAATVGAEGSLQGEDAASPSAGRDGLAQTQTTVTETAEEKAIRGK